MGSRKMWGGCCLGCAGVWVLHTLYVVLLGRAAGGIDSSGDLLIFLIVGLLPAVLPLAVGAVLLAAERASRAPQRRQQFVDEVYTAILEEDAVAIEEIAEKLNCRTQRVRAAVRDLVQERRLVGYREPETERLHAVDPASMHSGLCPCCGEHLDRPDCRQRCPQCDCEIYPPPKTQA